MSASRCNCNAHSALQRRVRIISFGTVVSDESLSINKWVSMNEDTSVGALVGIWSRMESSCCLASSVALLKRATSCSTLNDGMIYSLTSGWL